MDTQEHNMWIIDGEAMLAILCAEDHIMGLVYLPGSLGNLESFDEGGEG